MRQQHFLATSLFFLFSFSLLANHVDEYIQTYKDIAQREMRRSGIPASIILAQGIHESAWGRGKLAVNSNNHFGIKCKDYWEGPTFYTEDDDYENGKLIKSCFRSYDNVEFSYIDHTNFLVESPRYAKLFTYDKTDYRNWAKGLKECGYATDPKYTQKLIRIIEEHGLTQFDEDQPQLATTQIMEAPTFVIPVEFLQPQQQNTDPAIYVENDISTQDEHYVINQGNIIEPNSNFDYEVPREELPENPENQGVSTELIRNESNIELETLDNIVYQSPATGVIPNNTSNDKRLKNLGRKPRVSSGAGLR